MRRNEETKDLNGWTFRVQMTPSVAGNDLKFPSHVSFWVSEIMGPSSAFAPDYYHMGPVRLLLRYDEMEYIVGEIDEK